MNNYLPWAIAQALGHTPTFLWIGDDMVFGAGVLTSWPARYGSTLTPVGTTPITQGAVGGRVCGTNTTGGATVVRLANNDGATIQSSIIVAKVASLNFADYLGAALYEGPASGAREMFTGTSSANSWYNAGWTHYRNGSTTEICDTNWHVYQANAITPTALTKPTVFGSLTPSRNWQGSLALRLDDSVTISGAVQTALTAILRAYYAI